MGKDARGAARVEREWLRREAERRAKAKAAADREQLEAKEGQGSDRQP
jgi:hypothetical protein